MRDMNDDSVYCRPVLSDVVAFYCTKDKSWTKVEYIAPFFGAIAYKPKNLEEGYSDGEQMFLVATFDGLFPVRVGDVIYKENDTGFVKVLPKEKFEELYRRDS